MRNYNNEMERIVSKKEIYNFSSSILSIQQKLPLEDDRVL